LSGKQGGYLLRLISGAQHILRRISVLPKDKMPEAEVVLRFAMALITKGYKESSQGDFIEGQ